jgi:hypothetical protein
MTSYPPSALQLLFTRTATEKPDASSKIIFVKNLIFNKNLSLLDVPYPIEFITRVLSIKKTSN